MHAVEQNLAEISGMVKALIFIQTEAEPKQIECLHGSTVSMLYIITDKVDATVTRLARRKDDIPKEAAADFMLWPDLPHACKSCPKQQARNAW